MANSAVLELLRGTTGTAERASYDLDSEVNLRAEDVIVPLLDMSSLGDCIACAC